MDEKKCTKCGEIKPLLDFSIHRKNKDGRNCTCKACECKRVHDWMINNPDEYKRRAKIQYLRHRERDRANAIKYRKEHPEKIRNNNLRRYGIAQSDYEAMKESQSGKCLICQEEKKLYVDHNHITNKVRGLLCSNCNTAIGMIGENIKLAHEIIKYLEKS